jgi:hypothetical protein
MRYDFDASRPCLDRFAALEELERFNGFVTFVLVADDRQMAANLIWVVDGDPAKLERAEKSARTAWTPVPGLANGPIRRDHNVILVVGAPDNDGLPAAEDRVQKCLREAADTPS